MNDTQLNSCFHYTSSVTLDLQAHSTGVPLFSLYLIQSHTDIFSSCVYWNTVTPLSPLPTAHTQKHTFTVHVHFF